MVCGSLPRAQRLPGRKRRKSRGRAAEVFPLVRQDLRRSREISHLPAAAAAAGRPAKPPAWRGRAGKGAPGGDPGFPAFPQPGMGIPSLLARASRDAPQPPRGSRVLFLGFFSPLNLCGGSLGGSGWATLWRGGGWVVVLGIFPSSRPPPSPIWHPGSSLAVLQTPPSRLGCNCFGLPLGGCLPSKDEASPVVLHNQPSSDTSICLRIFFPRFAQILPPPPQIKSHTCDNPSPCRSWDFRRMQDLLPAAGKRLAIVVAEVPLCGGPQAGEGGPNSL